MRSLLIIALSIGIVISAGGDRNIGNHDKKKCSKATPRVTTSNGIVEGYCVTDSPKRINGFLGVPFAEPPVRFAKPVRKSNWTGVRITKSQPNQCIQVTAAASSEDCLYLNVYAPAQAPLAGHPVFVIVHGGGFGAGSANEGTPEHIAKNLAAKGLVVVAIQYRVGPLGFCTTKDSVLPGNYGMWDAKMAFEWIRDNIAAFGGNPNDVTAYGGSAGAALIDALHLAPHTTNLFHKMTIFSGAARDIWDVKSKEHCGERATSLGLTWTDSTSFKSALMGADVNGLRAGWVTIGESAFDTLLGDWAPVIDGDFFPSSVVEMRAATQPKPSIFGISFLDGASFASNLNLDVHTVEKIVDFMVPPGTSNRSEFQSFLIESYRNQGAILEPTAVDKHAAMAALGERNFAARMDAVLRRNFELFGSNQTAYRYVFKHFNPAQIGQSYPFISFASHTYDQWYSLGKPGFTFIGNDKIVVDLYTTALANFAKTGNPNGSGASALPVEWVAATAENPSLNYVIETTPYMDAQFFQGRPHLNNILNKNAGTFKPV